MNNKLTELTEAIHKALPEINRMVVVMSVEQLEEIAMDAGYFDTNKYTKQQDITLADVLRVIGKKFIKYKCGNPVFGQIRIGIDDSICEWDLSKPLHLQEQETIDFLHSIIVTKS